MTWWTWLLEILRSSNWSIPRRAPNPALQRTRVSVWASRLPLAPAAEGQCRSTRVQTSQGMIEWTKPRNKWRNDCSVSFRDRGLRFFRATMCGRQWVQAMLLVAKPLHASAMMTHGTSSFRRRPSLQSSATELSASISKRARTRLDSSPGWRLTSSAPPERARWWFAVKTDAARPRSFKPLSEFSTIGVVRSRQGTNSLRSYAR